ncbi:hypothetical protein CYMTET_14444 [Cymbomonas tetramitiformis]|uniref:Uncharacterized protein n=1 Tax=Cymbomonas tetramitiformis TaxID=36881 RepID=A0AAE0GGG3_9CHLO|nr:hypothetical protein CYMTET_14444 [Cymbomonas tetramitiformis]
MKTSGKERNSYRNFGKARQLSSRSGAKFKGQIWESSSTPIAWGTSRRPLSGAPNSQINGGSPGSHYPSNDYRVASAPARSGGEPIPLDDSEGVLPPMEEESEHKLDKPAYSIKYFGVCRGQLGVLTRRRMQGPEGAWRTSSPERHKTSSLQPSLSRGYGSVRPSTAGSEPAEALRTSSRPASAAPVTGIVGNQVMTVTQDQATGAQSLWKQDKIDHSEHAHYSRGAAPPNGEPPDGSSRLPEVDDMMGNVWLPTNAVYGRTLHRMRPTDRSPRKAQMASHRHRYGNYYSPVPGDMLPRTSQYISHNALMGWKLSPVAVKPYAHDANTR